MTRDEILAMEPGRELDAIVAEKVMSFHQLRFVQYPEENVLLGLEEGCSFHENGNSKFKRVASYSTDISAAWEVVEKVARGNNNRSFYLEFHYERAYAHFGNGEVTGYRTAPEAICKAALLAVMDA